MSRNLMFSENVVITLCFLLIHTLYRIVWPTYWALTSCTLKQPLCRTV